MSQRHEKHRGQERVTAFLPEKTALASGEGTLLKGDPGELQQVVLSPQRKTPVQRGRSLLQSCLQDPPAHLAASFPHAALPPASQAKDVVPQAPGHK